MPTKNYKEESRANWVKTTATESEVLNTSELQFGAILRIADGVEKMAQRHTDLIDNVEYWKRRSERAEKSNRTLERSNNALRGHLTRAKKLAKE